MPLKGTKSAFSESGFISTDTAGTPQTPNAYTQIQNIVTANSTTFQTTLDISRDGNYLAIGYPYVTSQTGRVDVYANANNVYTLQQTLTPPDIINRRFGSSISFNENGTVLAIGEPGINTTNANSQFTRVYTRSANTWSLIANLAPSQSGNAANGAIFGNRVSVSADGNYIAVGADRQNFSNTSSTESGMFYIFANSSNVWTEQANFIGPNITSYRLSFSGLEMNQDGTIVIAASQNSCQLSAYTRSGNTWTAYGNIANLANTGFNSNLQQAFQIDNTANIITGGNRVYSNAGNWSLTGNGAPDFLSSDGNIGINVAVGSAYNIVMLQGNVTGYSTASNIFYTVPPTTLFGNGQPSIGCAISKNADRLAVLSSDRTSVYIFDKN